MSSGAPAANELPAGTLGAATPPSAPAASYEFWTRLRVNSEYIVIPVFALLMAALPWFLGRLMGYTIGLFSDFHRFLGLG